MATTRVKDTEGRNFAARMPFDDLNECGTYVSEWSGHLLRIPEDGVKAGRSPVIEIVGKTPMYVVKLSDNPFLPLTKARMLAADLDISISF